MKTEPDNLSVKAWQFQGVVFESYHRAPGSTGSLPRHAHEEYQFTLSLTHTGQYYYQGAYHLVPVGSLSVIHPGELHQTHPLTIRQTPSRFRMMYVPTALMQQAAAAIVGREIGLPFFAESTLVNPDLAAQFLRLHQTLERTAAQLESESLLLLALTRLITGYAKDRPPLVVGSARTAVRRVREYLQENYAENVSLAELAHLAGLSAFHLTRLFAQEVGLPPHAYQTQVRIARSKVLLASGLPPGQVAIATGFYDQSHFGAHFKRLVGVTPGRYASKNFLDNDVES